MNTPIQYVGFSPEQEQRLRQLRAAVEGVRAADAELARMLFERNSLQPVLRRLNETTTPELLEKETKEERRLWQDVALALRFSGRTYDAIALLRQLYERICEQQQTTKVWLAKGMPLVWISECHQELGHHCLAARYLLLTAVADAIRDEGKLNADAGVYFRARWQHGWTDEELEKFYSDCFAPYDAEDPLCAFPEHIISKVVIPFVIPYATSSELDVYEVNRSYALKLLDSLNCRSGKVTGKELEELAAYLLGSIPGFEVRSDLRSDDTQYDGLVRNTGPKYDFRADLGFHLLIECKDWNEPVGVGQVSQFINKLFLQDCRGGFLFSSAGITGEGKNKDAELQLLKAHYRAGKIIIVLSEEDFRQAATGKNLTSMLRHKYEEIRFDIERPW